MTRVSLNFPLGGLSDDKAYSDQDPGTTREAVNVRGIDPVTGRERGGQREGQSKYLATPVDGSGNVQIQDLAVVTRDSGKLTYTNLTQGSLTLEWEKDADGGGDVPWVAVDLSENVYILDDGSAITKYNADGVKLRTVAIPTPENHSLVRKILVDGDGGVYAASYHEDYESGRVWRFVDSEVNSLELELAWEHEVQGAGVEMFGGNLYSVFYVSRYKEGFVSRKLNRLDDILTGTPTVTEFEECPGPVNAMEVDVNGALKMAVEDSATRGDGAAREGFTKTQSGSDLWNPHDLSNATERLYFWVDAENIDGEGNATLSDGDEITTWSDNRDYRTTDGIGAYGPVLDKTTRELLKVASWDSGALFTNPRPGPEYDPDGWAGKPAVLFRAGASAGLSSSSVTGAQLHTELNSASTAKTSKTDTSWNNSKAVFPANHKFMAFLVVRPFLNPGTGAQRLICAQNSTGTGGTAGSSDYSLLVDSVLSAGVPTLSAGSASFYDPSGNIAAGGGGLGQPLSDSYANDPSAMLVTIVHNGTGANDSLFRINGQYVDNFTLPNLLSHGNGAFTALGCREVGDGASGEDLFGGTYSSFSGYVAEVLVVLADSATGVHSDPIIAPGVTTYGFGTGGTCGQGEAFVSPSRSTEVERVEGYLAHKWGLSHLLTNGFSFVQSNAQTSGAGGMLNHPFGGSGFYPTTPTHLADADLLRFTRARHDAWKRDSSIIKYKPGSGVFEWVVSGQGMGYGLATDDDADTFALGPHSRPTSSTEPSWGPDNFDDEDVIARKVVDGGNRAKFDTAWRGWIAGAGLDNRSSAIPADGDTIELNDQTNPAVTFEFDGTGAYAGSNVLVDTNGATSVGDAMAALATAINAQGSLNIEAARAGEIMVAIAATVADNDDVGVTITSPGSDLTSGTTTEGFESTGDWRITNSSEPEQRGLGCAFDDNGDLWVPWLTDATDNRASKRDGDDGTELLYYDLDASLDLYCISLPLSRPAYIDQSPDPTGPLFMYLGSSGGDLTPPLDNLTKVRLISESQALGGAPTPRATRLLAVTSGSVYEVTTSSSSLKGSGFELEATSPYIHSTVAYNQVFWCDGLTYWVYDAVEDTMVEAKSKSAGSIPKGGKLIETWRGRLVIGRTEDDPQNVYMSRVGDPFNWDEFPAVADGLEAVSFGGTRVGRSADIVNALIPYNDDLLIVGGDHTIQRLTGDPASGGQLDLVSDITGIAYGRAWCKDPQGRLFFFGSRGGVYVMAPGGIPQRITRDRIERRLADLDLGTYKVRMIWNYRAEGLHVFAIPYVQPTLGQKPTVRSWFMDKNGSWWEDEFAANDVSPTAALVMDGDDPSDRVLLMGGADGHIRRWDDTAKDDDGYRVDSRVLIGPLLPPSSTQQAKFSRAQVTLGAEQDGAVFAMYATDTAEQLGLPVAQGRLARGQNPTLPARARGRMVYLRLRNAALEERWAFERMTVEIGPGGRERVR